MRRRHIKNRGFTLIETILYSALIAATIGAMLAVTYQIIQGSRAVSEKINSGEEAAFVIAKIKWALSSASTINSPGSGASSSTMSLSLADYTKNPVVFSLDNGVVYLQKHGGIRVPLTSSRIVVNNLIFTHIPASGKKPEGVRIGFSTLGIQYDKTFFLRK